MIDGICKFVMDVCELDVDWIDSINFFSEVYFILFKVMIESSFKVMVEVIVVKKYNIFVEEVRDLAKWVLKFK